MECTQRIWCTQDTYAGPAMTNSDQIGYLGIAGVKYPVKMGHNKIGRDPQVCSIVLDFKSVSRQHAVLIVLNCKEFNLMDLESANKTKVMNDNLKTLDPYIPYPIKHGDTIQFGDMVGVFKLLEDENNLPATQTLDVPDTPIRFTHFNQGTATTIPESPDVSDVETSFITGSSSKCITTPLHDDLFVKPNSTQRSRGINKIDNNYSNSSKKSKSFTSVKTPSEREGIDIYEMQTQILVCEKSENADPIYSAETQLPNNGDCIKTTFPGCPVAVSYDNIHETETQALLPEQNVPAVPGLATCASLSIHSLETQVSPPQLENITVPRKIQLDINLSDTEFDDSMFNAETQLNDEEKILTESGFHEDSKRSKLHEKSKFAYSTSDDDYTQCDDIFLSQQVQVPSEKNGLTICEDEDTTKENKDDIADMATQVLEYNPPENMNNDDELTDLPTQILLQNSPKQDDPGDLSKDISKEIMNPFKIPLQSNKKLKKKDASKITEVSMIEDRYYKLTQDIYDDLCSQKKESPVKENKTEELNEKDQNQDEILQCSQENYILGENFPHIEAQLRSPIGDSSASDGEKTINDFVSSLSKQDINNMIGVQAAPLKKIPSEGSDVDVTPKKSKPIRFSDLELPNSQDIKSSVSLPVQSSNETSSDSETDCSEDQNTPVLFRPKKKPKVDARKDLTKSFDIDALPTRILIRNRQAIGKELIDGVDSQIIHENIIRLKIDAEKKKGNKDLKKETINCDTKSRNHDTKAKNQKSRNQDSKDKTKENNSKSSGKDDKVHKKQSTNKTKIKEETPDSKHKTSVSPINRRPRRRKLEVKRYSSSPVREMEVRRSKRQRTLKEVLEPVKETKSILKKTDQSAVYNVSSELNEASSRHLKRSAEKDSEASRPKRSKYAGSSRATPVRRVKIQHVLFTAFPSEQVQHKLEKLGAKVVTDVKQCTVVLTMQIKRTFKLLCAVALGKPIVGPNWVQACVDTNMIVDPWLYVIKDDRFEQRYQFSLERTLKGNRNYLDSYNISATPNVMPPANEMKLIVECSGGTWKEGGPRWVCVTCKADSGLWPGLKERGAALVSTEFILKGVLKQRLDIAANLVYK